MQPVFARNHLLGTLFPPLLTSLLEEIFGPSAYDLTFKTTGFFGFGPLLTVIFTSKNIKMGQMISNILGMKKPRKRLVYAVFQVFATID